MTVATQPFVITRELDAPRELVWKAWTEAERLRQWWGPAGFKVHTCKLDLRPGGFFHYGMKAPDGSDMWGRFVFREIVAPERLVFINSFSDPQGGLARAPFPEPWPMEMLSTITFEARKRKTRVSVTWLPHNATEAELQTFEKGRESMKQGWTGTFDQFAAYLARSAP